MALLLRATVLAIVFTFAATLSGRAALLNNNSDQITDIRDAEVRQSSLSDLEVVKNICVAVLSECDLLVELVFQTDSIAAIGAQTLWDEMYSKAVDDLLHGAPEWTTGCPISGRCAAAKSYVDFDAPSIVRTISTTKSYSPLVSIQQIGESSVKRDMPVVSPVFPALFNFAARIFDSYALLLLVVASAGLTALWSMIRRGNATYR